jgi:protein TonB
MQVQFKLAMGIVIATFVAVGAAQERPGDGVTSPVVVKEVKPDYTPDARKARIEGMVVLDVVVLEDGTVGDVKVTQSLDQQYGLDEQAVKAVKQWRFRPGTKDGKPVPVIVFVEISFALK